MQQALSSTDMDFTSKLKQFIPITDWLSIYNRQQFSDDIFAGIITAILLVPQGIAYALLAGLPAQYGLYASIFPPLAYALLGSSKTLSVGPVSIAAIMIAHTLAAPEIQALNAPLENALLLAGESGLILLLMAILRMGQLVNFISHPVLTGFTSGASILIIASQLPQLAGLKTPDCAWNGHCYLNYIKTYNPATISLSIATLLLLVFFATHLTTLLTKFNTKTALITSISKCGPLLAVVCSTFAVSYFNLATEHQVAIVGKVPAGFPSFNLNFIQLKSLKLLLPYALFISVIAYVESVAIAKVTANLRGEKINPDQELIALAIANIAAACSGAMCVAGGFSRTMVNFAAGAKTQMAMLIAAGLLSLTVIFFTPWFANMPKAALAAIILLAISPLVKIKNIIHTWQYDRGDGIAELATLLGVVILGIEQGIVLGIVLTIASHLRKSSQPHIAVVGRIPNTEHYRNIKRHQVETWPHLLLIRIDDNITFTNTDYIENYLFMELKRQPNIQHVILICTSISDIDTTALEALEKINQTLQATGKTLNISEAKGPVLDKLQKTDFFEQLKPGNVFFRTEDAIKELA